MNDEHDYKIARLVAWCIGVCLCCLIVTIGGCAAYKNHLTFSGGWYEEIVLSQCYQGRAWKKRGAE